VRSSRRDPPTVGGSLQTGPDSGPPTPAAGGFEGLLGIEAFETASSGSGLAAGADAERTRDTLSPTAQEEGSQA
jgi:hypothetical protein